MKAGIFLLFNLGHYNVIQLVQKSYRAPILVYSDPSLFRGSAITGSVLRRIKRAQEIDDNMIRAVEFSNCIDVVMAVYKSIFVQKKKQRLQLPITMFLVHRKPPAVTTHPPAPFPASSAASSEEQ